MSNRNTASRQHRVTEVWNWLPAFRAVAELEHVQTAAQQLHVTASSLSRAIRLIEDHLGTPLFERAGRNVRLNPHGAELLAAVRDGMRRIDNGLSAIRDDNTASQLRTWGDRSFSLNLLWRSALRLRQAHPGLSVSVEERSPDSPVARQLLAGHLDLALCARASPHRQLQIDLLDELAVGIYCGAEHSLFGHNDVSKDTLSMHPFVAHARDESSVQEDGWPPELNRSVDLRLPSSQSLGEVCASSRMLAVLTHQEAKDASLQKRLWCLNDSLLSPMKIYVVRRLPQGQDDLAALLVAALREETRAEVRAT